MIYTIIFYLLLLFFSTFVANSNRKLAIDGIFLIIVAYMGLRYDYMPDYKNYLNYFELVQSGCDFNYSDHMEYGWYLLNKFFSPIGFFAFNFVLSLIMGYAIRLYLNDDVTNDYLPYVVLGYFSSGIFTLALSALRQFVVASIFMIAFFYLIRGRIRDISDLFNWRTILYFVIIYLCSKLHSSASFLYVIPFFYFLPKNKLFSLICLVGIFLTIFIGDRFLPQLVGVFYEQYDRYVDILDHEIEMENMTSLSFLSYSFQVVVLVSVYAAANLTKDIRVIIFLALFSIFCSVSIFSISQMYRLNVYIGFFLYLAIDHSCRFFEDKKLRGFFIKLFYGVWIFWNCLKIFSIKQGSVEEYKTVFDLLFI